MKPHNKLTSHEKEAQQSTQQHTQSSSENEFATVEEMLRHDAIHTPVPPAIAHRLSDSMAQLPAPPRPWWRRLLGS